MAKSEPIRNATVVLAEGKIPRYELADGRVIEGKRVAAWTLVRSDTDEEMMNHLARSMLFLKMEEYILDALGFNEEWFETTPPFAESPEHARVYDEAKETAAGIIEQVEIKINTAPYESFDKEEWVLRAAAIFERTTGKKVEFNDGWKEE